MPVPRWLLVFLALLACGGAGEGSLSPAAAAGAAPDAATAWEDPEPPDAQARAEAVVDAEWNRDKLTRLQPKTTRLRSSITTLVDQRTGLVGVAQGLVKKEARLEDRLARLGAEITDAEVKIRLAGAVLFDFDSDRIRVDAATALREVVEVVQAYAGRPVRIEGHTDSIASDAYNQALSERRAAAVRDWLQEHGVAASRLSIRGFGESKPVAANGTAAGRQLNRRVEIVIGLQEP